jgi:hypothetical protein
MKKLSILLALLFVFLVSISNAQSVKINFVRYKQIQFNTYLSEWENWPTAWNESGAYAIIRNIYDGMYEVSIYSYDDSFLVSSTCTFDSNVTTKKRDSQDLPYLNCYSDTEGDQVWTNVVSLKSLTEDVTGWKQDGAQLYLWIFSAETPFSFVFE